MAADFKYLVVGRGMMGAAAARHLAKQTDGVGVIGPDEPLDRKSHDGVFASHYDEGRITRTIDPDADWALLANRSIARYGDIARESGIDFYQPAGCLIVGAKRGGQDDFIERTTTAAKALGVEAGVLDDQALSARFPFFSFPTGSEGVHETTGAGHISPRRLVRAQSLIAEKNGARIIKDVATVIGDEAGLARVETSAGKSYTAEKVLLAAGGFSIAENLLAAPVEVKVYARTVTYFEVGEEEAQRLAAMPSLISEPGGDIDSVYVLPPIRYPDGKLYLKIGGDPDDLLLGSEPELRTWFRADGREWAKSHLTRIIRKLIPGLEALSISTGSCVVSYTPSGYPMIGYTSSPRIAVLTGGCGRAAKSSDEIGRLGAELLLRGGIKDAGYTADFAAYFRQ